MGLDPRDADTDNDRISDGDEVNGSWIVRVVGQIPYQTYSNPTVADADFDRLVDGDEKLAGSDPGKSNTDGDARDDYAEVTTGLNATQEDFRVTVILQSLSILSDGDRDSDDDDVDGDPGEFKLDFGVRKPDSTTLTGIGDSIDFVRRAGDGIFEISSGSDTGNNTIPRFHRFTNANAINFSMTSTQRFSIEGTLFEDDGDHPGAELSFGGIFGEMIKLNGSERLGVFEGSEITGKAVQALTFDFETGFGHNYLKGTLNFIIIVDSNVGG